MPGRGSYGPAGKWVHDRAHYILDKADDMPKGMAYALATQQAHKVGKSPKKFRTREGMREARQKYRFPKNLYKKTASDTKVAATLSRLKRLQKEAETKRTRKFKGVTGYMRTPQRGAYRNLYAPPGMEAVRRGRMERAILGSGASPMRLRRKKPRPPGFFSRQADNMAMALADRIRYGGLKEAPISVAEPARKYVPFEKAAPQKAVQKSILSNPTAKKLLRVGGLGALGVGAGAAAHQLAHSVGLTERGPADVIADIVVPNSKYSYDLVATEQLLESEMYIPRYYLEKAAAEMAGALESNDDTVHLGEPQMFGAEASVVPQQMLETVVPIRQHVERSDKESDDFIHKMFENYKATKEESVGRYARGETEVPIKAQAGRITVN